MSYLNLDLNYFEHPKIVRLAGLLGKGAELYPIRLWIYTGKFYPENGALKNHGFKEVESIVGWSGDAKQCYDAMMKVELIKEDGQNIAVHDWLEHQGHLMMFKKRAENAAQKRWRIGTKSSNATSNAKVGGQAMPQTVPNRTKPNSTVPNKKRTFVPTAEAAELVALLITCMRHNKPDIKIPGNLIPWQKEADLLLRKDRRNFDEAKAVLIWCQEDSFWKTNILSMSKFRKQYDSLCLKRQGELNATKQKGGGQNDAGVGEPSKYDRITQRIQV